jgi:ketosteroid isomerase-like protein
MRPNVTVRQISRMTDRQQIEAAIARFIAAYNAGDAATLINCYDADLVKLRQGAPPESRDEAAARISNVMAAYAGRLEVRNDEFLIAGDLAVVRGQLRIELTPRAGGSGQVLQRRFLEVWRKKNGEWLVFRTMDNTE